MTLTKARALIGALAAVAMFAPATGAFAQESNNRVAVKTDWSVFTEGNPKECWGVSSPKSSRITEDGKPVKAQRGDILLFVTYRPGHDGKGAVSFTGGYPFEKDSTAEMKIGNDSFTMITDGEWAWPKSPDDDPKVIAAMKQGADAVVTAHSARGKVTEDTFSLSGFSAAAEDAATRCK